MPLFDEVRLECSLSVARDRDVDGALLSFHRFLARPIALAALSGIARMVLQFRFQAAFNHGFGQLFEQASFSHNLLGV